MVYTCVYALLIEKNDTSACLYPCFLQDGVGRMGWGRGGGNCNNQFQAGLALRCEAGSSFLSSDLKNHHQLDPSALAEYGATSRRCRHVCMAQLGRPYRMCSYVEFTCKTCGIWRHPLLSFASQKYILTGKLAQFLHRRKFTYFHGAKLICLGEAGLSGLTQFRPW